MRNTNPHPSRSLRRSAGVRAGCRNPERSEGSSHARDRRLRLVRAARTSAFERGRGPLSPAEARIYVVGVCECDRKKCVSLTHMRLTWGNPEPKEGSLQVSSLRISSSQTDDGTPVPPREPQRPPPLPISPHRSGQLPTWCSPKSETGFAPRVLYI